MTLAERAAMATEVRQERAHKRAEELCRLLSEGEHIKRAAWLVGVSHRHAKRYRKWVR